MLGLGSPKPDPDRNPHPSPNQALALTSTLAVHKVWYTVCSRRGSVGAWDEAAMEVPFFCSSNNSQTGMAHCDSSVSRRENPVLG